MKKEYINTLIKYKWQTGVYKIQDMLKLVENGTINKQDFFEITRYNYNGIKTIRSKLKLLEIRKNL